MADILSRLAGYWPLNGNFNDYSGFSNYGIGYGSPAISFVPGRYGQQAAQFVPANSNYVKTALAFGPYPITMSAWAKRTSSSQTDGTEFLICSTSNSATGDYIFMSYYYYSGRGKTIRILAKDNAGHENGAEFGVVYDTLWHHYVGIAVSGTSFALYVDGKSIAGNDPYSGYNVIPSGLNSFNIGALYYNGGTTYGLMNGSIYGVHAYTRTLAATDATQLYMLGKRNLKLTQITQITQIPKFYNIPFRWNAKATGLGSITF